MKFIIYEIYYLKGIKLVYFLILKDMKTNKTAYIYCRVSTLKQKKEWDSFNTQENACRKYCKLNNIKVIDVFYEAFSGKSSDRPVFNNAIKMAKENNINYFLVFDIDRFSREWYSKYTDFKNTLKESWILLKDSKNIIWDEKVIMENEIIDMSKYTWNVENPTEMSEMVYSAQASIEWNKILQRTISKEITLEQKWHHVRAPNFWYKLKKVETIINWDKCFAKNQIINEIEWPWIEEIFIQKNKWILSDKEITQKVNLMWYKSRKWKKLTIKQMQVYIKMPVYAWVICSKWTWNKPIYTAYNWLISIDIWNKANKWKYKILEKSNWELQILNWEKEVEEPIIKKRKKFDEDLPFRNLIKSSIIKEKYISGSKSVNSKKQIFPYYHPVRQKWTTGENIKKEEFENNIYSLLEEIKIDEITEILFSDVFDIIFEKNKEELVKNKIILKNRLKWIKSEIIREEAKVDNVMHLPRLLNNINKKLEELDQEEININEEISQFDNKKIDDVEKFKNFCFYILGHFDELVKKSQNSEELQVIFKFIFKEVPHYEQIVNRTAPLQPILALQRQQKNSQNESLDDNLKWQPH